MMNEFEITKDKFTHELVDLCTNKVNTDITGLLTYISYMKKNGSLDQIDNLNLTLEEIRVLDEVLNDKEKLQLRKALIYLYLDKPSAILTVKLTNFANALTSIMLTQIVLLDTYANTEAYNSNLMNGLTGISVGIVIIILRLYMIIGINKIQRVD